MRIAVVHDWLYVLGGAEKVLRAIFQCFPQADLFCLFDVLSPSDRKFIGYTASRNSFLQRMPLITRGHRLYLPLMPIAIEQLDLSTYDLVISSSYAVAKGVLTGPDQLHISYVHSPMRYAWDLQHEYLRQSGIERGVKSWLARSLLHRMRLWDYRTSNGVNHFIANSQFIARRISKVYGRSAEVIYPPVAIADFRPASKGDYFLTASRLVAYKNVHAIVEAFTLLPEQRLIVAGCGPELERLRALAGPNVTFVGFVPDDELKRLMAAARAFIFAAEEDFGIVVVEAQACGTPVLALRRGGVRESIRMNVDSPTGIFFERAAADAIAEAVRRFIAAADQFDPHACYVNSLRFSESRFKREFTSFVVDRYDEFATQRELGSCDASALPAEIAEPLAPVLAWRGEENRRKVMGM